MRGAQGSHSGEGPVETEIQACPALPTRPEPWQGAGAAEKGGLLLVGATSGDTSHLPIGVAFLICPESL